MAGALSAVLDWSLSMHIKTNKCTRVVVTGNEYRPSDFLLGCGLKKKRWVGLVMIPISGSTQLGVNVKHTPFYHTNGLNCQNH